MTTPATEELTINGTLLLLRINGEWYEVASTGRRSWRLRKVGKEAVYDVTERATCDCPDSIYRRRDETRQPCKHVRGLREAGLLPEIR